MHHGNIVSRVVRGVNFARVGKPGLFFDRKRVELGTQQNRRAHSVLQDRHDSGTPDVFRNVIPEGAQSPCQLRRCLRFMRR